MEQTTNYELRKYQSGDLFNPLTVNNPNLDDIDSDMKAISDRAIGRATELVSQGVHAITVLDTDCKTIKWFATANFNAGETFTINGIQCNAYLPSGESLGGNAYVSGAQVIASLNADNSAMTVYVPQGTVAVASDSERLGGQLPSYYATKSYADGIKDTADTSRDLIQKKALVNTYYDSSTDKLYQVNADGTQGNEIKRFKNYTLLASHSGGATNYTIPSILNYNEILVVCNATGDNSLRNSFYFPINLIDYGKANELSATSQFLMSFRLENETTLVLYTQNSYININVYAR